MKTPGKTLKAVVVGAALAAALLPASAAVFNYNFNSGFANGGVIPDGNVTGWSDTRTLSGISLVQIADVDVTLHLSGGYNGDLYAYLVHDSGFTVLLNRVGATAGNHYGYSDAGMNITLSDQASTDVHLYGTLANPYTYQPDARNVDPASAIDTSSRDLVNFGLGSFNNLDPNGTWTLFFADMATGDTSTVVDWGLSITAVPEPANVALFIFAIIAVLVGLKGWQPRKPALARVSPSLPSSRKSSL